MQVQAKVVPDLPQISKAEQEQLEKVSKQFEALFMNQLVSAMRQTVKQEGIVAQSHGEKVYQSMLDYEYANKISESGQVGLSKMIYDQLVRSRFGGR